MCKTNDLNTVLWTVTGNRCHVPPKLVLFSLQQETCFMQNLQHATASLTAVDSWALGQNSLGEKLHKGGKKWNRFVAETEMYVCFVKSSFKLQKEIMRVLSEIMYWWTSYTDHGQLRFFLWCAHIYTRTLQVHTSEWTGIAELLKKTGWSCYYGSRNTMFPSPASETLPWGQSLIIFSEHYF